MFMKKSLKTHTSVDDLKLKKKPKIILLTEYFPPEIGAGSTRAYEHAKRWVESGANVRVITCMPHYPSGVIPEKYMGKNFYKEEIDGIEVIRTYTFAAASKGFVLRSLAYFAFMISSIVQGSFYVKSFDYIIATSPPFSIGISGLILSKIKRIPLVLEVRDIWPESLIQLGQIKNKLLIKFLEWIEKIIYSNAKHIISVTDSYCSLISAKGIDKSKISIVKNGVDLDFFTPIEKDLELKGKLNISGKKIVSYFGNFGISQPIDKIIEVANILKKETSITFLIIGDGERKEQIHEMIGKFELNNVVIINSVKKNELIKYYSISDLMLVPLKKINIFLSVIPSKIFEIMAMQKPILLSVDGEARKLIEEAGAGIYSDLEKLEKFADDLSRVINDPVRLNKMAQNGREFVELNFDRNMLANKLLKIIR